VDILRITKLNEVYIKIHCNTGLAYELSEYFSFKVPGAEWSPKFKAKVWDGKIRLFNIMSGTLYAGLLYAVEKFCQDRKYEIEYSDDFSATEFSLKEAKKFIDTLNLPDKYKARDYQLDAFVYAVRNNRALFLSPTASGKSFIIYLITRYYQHVSKGRCRILIVVPSISLVTQLAGDFADYGMSLDGNVHQITGGVDKKTSYPITISTWQSIYKLDKKYFKQFDLVMGDEAHLFKAKSLISILTKCEEAPYRFGFTGTLDGSKTNKLVLEGLFGRVRKVTTTAELIAKGTLSSFKIKAIVLNYPEHIRKESANKRKIYTEEIDFIVTNPRRNRFIRNLALSLKGNTMVLFQFVDKHGKVLYDMIKSAAGDRNVYYVSGEIEGEDRELIRKAVEKDKDCIIVASVVFATGVNIVNLQNIIFSSPSKSRIRNLQAIGRVLRKSATSTEAELFDIADDLQWKSRKNHTLKHFIERIQIYSQEKFPYKIYPVKLKDNDD
jgi:superfamily II DNA or RNA helicase